MNIYFINKLIINFYIKFDYAEGIYIDLSNRGLIEEATKDIDEMDSIETFIRKYYKELTKKVWVM